MPGTRSLTVDAALGRRMVLDLSRHNLRTVRATTILGWVGVGGVVLLATGSGVPLTGRLESPIVSVSVNKPIG